jgi:hypothetical protein
LLIVKLSMEKGVYMMSFRSFCQHISTFCDTFFHVLIQWKLQKTGLLRKLVPSGKLIYSIYPMQIVLLHFQSDSRNKLTCLLSYTGLSEKGAHFFSPIYCRFMEISLY